MLIGLCYGCKTLAFSRPDILWSRLNCAIPKLEYCILGIFGFVIPSMAKLSLCYLNIHPFLKERLNIPKSLL